MITEVLPEYLGSRRKIFSGVSISMRFLAAVVSVLTWEVSEEVFLTVFFKEEDNADPEEKISGSKLYEQIRISHPRVCPLCHGTGAASGSEPRICKTCNGTGQLINTRQEGNVSYQEIRTCPNCGGRGKFIDKPCLKCRGTGKIDEPETLTVKIPVGAEEGMVLRIPSHGRPSAKADGKPGDLLVIVRTAYDNRFKRSGTDLWYEKSIELIDAVLGAEIEVATLEEPVTVTVPQGTQPNAVLRLGEKGLPHFGDTKRGDLYLRLDVHIPENLSDEEKELYTRLKRLRIDR
jgi:molecular chaperone DnaJ